MDSSFPLGENGYFHSGDLLPTVAADGLSIQWLLDPDFDMTHAFNRFADLIKSDLNTGSD